MESEDKIKHISNLHDTLVSCLVDESISDWIMEPSSGNQVVYHFSFATVFNQQCRQNRTN